MQVKYVIYYILCLISGWWWPKCRSKRDTICFKDLILISINSCVDGS